MKARSPRLDPAREASFFEGAREAEKFFMGEARVHRALERLVCLLEDEGIPYAIVGGMALNEFGYHRVTEGVDVLLTVEGLGAFKHAGQPRAPRHREQRPHRRGSQRRLSGRNEKGSGPFSAAEKGPDPFFGSLESRRRKDLEAGVDRFLVDLLDFKSSAPPHKRWVGSIPMHSRQLPSPAPEGQNAR